MFGVCVRVCGFAKNKCVLSYTAFVCLSVSAHVCVNYCVVLYNLCFEKVCYLCVGVYAECVCFVSDVLCDVVWLVYIIDAFWCVCILC